jgi:hypothetical protein
MVYVIGIDFGTSNSCVTCATYERSSTGKLDPHPISPPTPIAIDGRETVPTVLCLGTEDGDELLFGEVAEEKAALYPERVRAGFKIRLGAPGDAGQDAFHWTREFLTHLRALAAEHVPLDAEGKRDQIHTVIGHPVQWTADQRDETRRAAEEAGFPNVQLEDESLAALYAHLCEEGSSFRPEAGSRVMMIDMGGGTTDFAFLHIPSRAGERPVSRPVDPAPLVAPWRPGHESYGGRDLDALLLQHLARDWEPAWVARHRAALMRAVRLFKESFSNAVRDGRDAYDTLWLVDGRECRVSLNRDEFEEVAADYIGHLEKLIHAALSLGSVHAGEVATVVLTGGASRWYFVDETLKRVFPQGKGRWGGEMETKKPPSLSVSATSPFLLRHSHPEQSVAWGLGYVPMVRSAGATILAPIRKSAHSLWVHVPYGTRAAKSNHGATGRRGDGARGAAWDEPLLILPRGHQLPHITPKPLRIAVNKLALDPKEATVRLQFFSSAGGTTRVPLYERVARFERGPFESLWQRLSSCLPWCKKAEEDQFELFVACSIDENELLSAEVVIVRYYKGKEVAVQRQRLSTQREPQAVAETADAQPQRLAA